MPSNRTPFPQLTYCTNVHPAHSSGDVIEMLRGPVSTVRRLRDMGPHPDHVPFCVGLRLSAQASRQFASDPEAMSRLQAQLREGAMFVPTINGFPFGAFHGEPVKEQVYLPDWLSQERVDYTSDLLDVLCKLLPSTQTGSISTVPGAFRANAATATQLQAIRNALLTVVAKLARLEKETGKHIVLALEPEPACLLETMSDAVAFFEGHLLTGDSQRHLSSLGFPAAHAESLIRRHLGVCLDTCHSAVEFEPALDSYLRYLAAGIVVPKVQISAGLIVDPTEPEQLAALRDFDEPTYLHQVVARNAGQLTRFDDLPQAFAAHTAAAEDAQPAEDAQWRVHFHVPLFTDEYGAFRSTRSEITPLLEHLRGSDDQPLLEVETYTWDVLPERFRNEDKCAAIARELAWVAEQLGGDRDAAT